MRNAFPIAALFTALLYTHLGCAGIFGDTARVPPGSVSISGRVVDEATGAPIEGAQVHLSRTGREFQRTTPQDGTFLFQHLEQGTYEVQVTAPGYREHRDRIYAGKEGSSLNFRLRH